jgi:endonuclease/exonuclease/phosphatase family metal-dependent hydrolase
MRFTLISQNFFDVPLLNRHRINKIRLLIDSIIEKNPEIICLQELTFPYSRKLILHKLISAGYKVFAQKYLFGFNRGGLLVASKYPIVYGEYIPYADRGVLASLQIADRAISKGFIHTKIKINSKLINLINTHLYCVYDDANQIQANSHESQLNQLLGYVNSLPGSTIVCGDLSERSGDSISFTNALSKTKLINLMSMVIQNRVSVENTNVIYQNKFFHAGIIGGKFDFVLATKDLSNSVSKMELFGTHPLKVKNIDEHLSDHYGLKVELEFGL